MPKILEIYERHLARLKELLLNRDSEGLAALLKERGSSARGCPGSANGPWSRPSNPTIPHGLPIHPVIPRLLRRLQPCGSAELHPEASFICQTDLCHARPLYIHLVLVYGFKHLYRSYL